MKPLPNIDIMQLYSKEREQSSSDYRHHATTLFHNIKEEENPIDFMNQLLAITRLYFDGICEKESRNWENIRKGVNYLRGRDEDIWDIQKKALDRLTSAGKLAIGSFYRGEGIPTEEVRSIILSVVDDVLPFCPEKKAKGRHLNLLHDKIQKFGRNLPEILDCEEIDTIVPVASGGFESAFLAMDILDTPTLLPVRFSRCKHSDSEVKIPFRAPDDYLPVEGKNVLVTEDLTIRGTSIGKVMELLLEKDPAIVFGMSVSNSHQDVEGLSPIILNMDEPFACKNFPSEEVVIA